MVANSRESINVIHPCDTTIVRVDWLDLVCTYRALIRLMLMARITSHDANLKSQSRLKSKIMCVMSPASSAPVLTFLEVIDN
jgi:hypothetical protein